MCHKNFRIRQGELDLVMRDKNTLVFIEVKTDTTGQAGQPEEWVTPAKQKKIQKMALAYCGLLGIHDDTPMRFDVVSITRAGSAHQIRHFENAFLPPLNQYY